MGGGAQASLRHLTNIFRRVYRIFAHAWFQHRDVFWQVEGLDGLYVFFKTVCDVYNLIPEDNWTIPPEAEGEETRPHKSEEGQKMTILRKEDRLNPEAGSDRGPSSLGMGATTRRHRHSPSTGAAVSTITETAEDEDSTRNTSRMSVIGRPQSRDSLLERESHAAVEEVSATVASEAPEEVPEATDDATTALPEKITDKEPVETANFSHSVVSPTLKSNSIPDDVNEKEADESEAAAAETVGEPQGPELDSKRNTEHNPAFLPELEDEPENIQKSEEEPEDQPEQGCESEMEPEESIHRLEEPTGHDVECEPKKLKEPEDPPKDQSEDDTTHGPETGAETSPESQEASSQEQQKEQEGTDNENEKQEPKSEEDTAPSEEQALETEPSDDSLAEPKEVSEEASNVSREDNNETAPEEEKSSQVTTEGDSDPLGESQPSPKITPQEEEKTEKT